jgi:sarcosine oxidase subunit gamma
MLDTVRIDVARVSVLSGRKSVRLKLWLHQDPGMCAATEIGRLRLPARVGTTIPGDPRVLCVAPREWLLVSDVLAGCELREHIERQAGQNVAVADLSDGLAVLRIEGSAAQEALTKGCGLDLHPRTFHEGLCARTRFAQIAVTLDRLASNQFDLYVGRSYLAYLHSWLIDSMVELRAP